MRTLNFRVKKTQNDKLELWKKGSIRKNNKTKRKKTFKQKKKPKKSLKRCSKSLYLWYKFGFRTMVSWIKITIFTGTRKMLINLTSGSNIMPFNCSFFINLGGNWKKFNHKNISLVSKCMSGVWTNCSIFVEDDSPFQKYCQ